MRRMVAVALVALGLGSCAPAPALPKACATSGIERIGGPISLVDEHGRAVTQADFAGKPTVLYFGFANCPDVCPTSLQALRVALEKRAKGAAALNVALVTVDPARDTPEVLARYVASPAFPPGLKGLTGAPAQTKAAADAFKVFAQRRDDPGSAAGYSFDHTSMLYLMSREWRPLALFPSEMAPADMAMCIDGALAKAH